EVAELLGGYLAHLCQPTTVPAPQLSSPPRSAAGAANSTGAASGSSRSRGLLAALVLASLGLAVLGVIPVLVALANPPGQNVQVQRPSVDPPGESAHVRTVAISQDGKVLAGGAGLWDQPGEIGIWNLATREPLQRFTEELGIASVVLS